MPAGALAPVVSVIAITLGSQVIVSMGSATMPTIAPKLAQALGINPALIGLQVGIAYGAAAIGALFGGGLVRRMGPCRALQVCLAMTALGAAIATTPSVFAIALASVLIGASIGLINPPSTQLIMRVAAATQLNLVFSLKQTGVPLGFMFTALTAPIIAVTLGWRWSLALVCAVAVAAIGYLQRWRVRWDTGRDPSAPLVASPLAGIREVWIRPQIRWLVLCGSAYSAVQVCVSTFTVTMLVQEGGFDLVAAGLVASLANVAGVIARVIWGWLADRIASGQAVLIAVGLIMGAACVLVASAQPQWPRFATYLIFVALGASAIGWNGILHAEVARLTPARLQGLTSSGLSFFVFGAICLMPAAATALYPIAGSYAFIFGTVTAFALLGLALLAAARRAAL